MSTVIHAPWGQVYASDHPSELHRALEHFAEECDRLRVQLVAMDAQLLDANPEIARLRGLIRDGCRAGEDLAECPWCIYMHSVERNERARRLGTSGNYIHALDCPAFTPEGTVK